MNKHDFIVAYSLNGEAVWIHNLYMGLELTDSRPYLRWQDGLRTHRKDLT